MSDATELWDAVVLSYDEPGLISLTNTGTGAPTSIDTARGVDAAQTTINLWSGYAQVAYDSTNAAHVEVAKFGVIAIMWKRGGSSTEIAKVQFDEVFSPEGMIAKIKRTGPRGRMAPSTNSRVTTKSESSNGRNVRGWSDRDSIPNGILPKRNLAED